MIARVLKPQERVTSSSSSFSSADSSNNEEEDKEEVNQLVRRKRRVVDPNLASKDLAIDPILLLSSDIEDSNDLDFDPFQSEG